jgi:hypothetical protein
MSDDLGRTRRHFIRSVGSAVGAVALGAAAGPIALAADLPHLSITDPTAVSLHYTENSAKIDAAKDPTHTAGARCANCQFFQGGANEAYGPCQLFAGKAVSAQGWCMGYQKKA